MNHFRIVKARHLSSCLMLGLDLHRATMVCSCQIILYILVTSNYEDEVVRSISSIHIITFCYFIHSLALCHCGFTKSKRVEARARQ